VQVGLGRHRLDIGNLDPGSIIGGHLIISHFCHVGIKALKLRLMTRIISSSIIRCVLCTMQFFDVSLLFCSILNSPLSYQAKTCGDSLSIVVT